MDHEQEHILHKKHHSPGISVVLTPTFDQDILQRASAADKISHSKDTTEIADTLWLIKMNDNLDQRVIHRANWLPS